jgi:hypothetical protein
MDELWGFNVRDQHIHDSDDIQTHSITRSTGRFVFSGQDNVFCISDTHLKGISKVVDQVKNPDRRWKNNNFLKGELMLKTEEQVKRHVMKHHYSNNSIVSIAIGKDVYHTKIDRKEKESYINALKHLIQKVCEGLKIEFKGELK